MRKARSSLPVIIFLMLASGICGPELAHGQLRWQWPRKEAVRLRLVALAWNHPRSSVFESNEIFIAEKELTKDESRLVKLVFGFLPYQPRLSDYGLDYAVMHEMHAARDPQCDETLQQMMSGQVGDWRQPAHLKYSTDAPVLDVARHRNPLPCYVTNADEYIKPVPDAAEPSDH